MKKLLMSVVLLILILAPGISYSQQKLLPLAKDIEKHTKTLRTILTDVSNVDQEILPVVAKEEAYYNRILVEIIHRTFLVYSFSSDVLHLIDKGAIREEMLDECKDTLCKDMVFLHIYLERLTKRKAKYHLEISLRQLRLLTVKIKNTRLSYQLNKVIDIVSSTLELIYKTDYKKK